MIVDSYDSFLPQHFSAIVVPRVFFYEYFWAQQYQGFKGIVVYYHTRSFWLNRYCGTQLFWGNGGIRLYCSRTFKLHGWGNKNTYFSCLGHLVGKGLRLSEYQRRFNSDVLHHLFVLVFAVQNTRSTWGQLLIFWLWLCELGSLFVIHKSLNIPTICQCCTFRIAVPVCNIYSGLLTCVVKRSFYGVHFRFHMSFAKIIIIRMHGIASIFFFVMIRAAKRLVTNLLLFIRSKHFTNMRSHTHSWPVGLAHRV